MKIICETKDGLSPRRIIAGRAQIAAGFRQRLIGLMFRESFGEIDALIFERCRAIHTFFMRFPIDILCLDKHGIVIDMKSSLEPGRCYVPANKPETIIELPRGILSNQIISVGERIAFEES